MKIGLDARFLTHPQRGGFKSYTNTVIASLAEADSDDQFILYTDRPMTSAVRLPGNFAVKPVRSRNSVIREQVLLPAAMNRDRVDVAHFPCNTAPVRFAGRMAVTIHDTIPFRNGRSRPANTKQRFIQAYWRATIPRCARNADLVVADSSYVRDDLRVRFGVPDERLRVVSLPIDPAFLGDAPGLQPAGLGLPSFFVLGFASPDGRKNHECSIRAFNLIASEFPGLKLVLVCSHRRTRECITQGNGVMPIGPVSFEELLWLYRNAASLVFPSFDEGFGLPPLEAMACGTPVVVSKAGSLPEVVGECGVYADPSDVAGIAEGMCRVLGDEGLRRTLIESGRKRAARFSRKRMGEDLIAAYADAAWERKIAA